MSTNALPLLISLFLLLLMPWQSNTLADENKSTNRVILCFGDSLTAGYGLSPSDSYPTLLQQQIDSKGLNFRVINAGLSGDTTASGLRRIDWFLQERIDVFLLALGANDGLRGLPISSMKNNLREMIAKVRKTHPAARIVVAGMLVPPNMGDRYGSKFQSVFREVAEETKANLIPFLLEGVAGKQEMNLADGIHPNVEGQLRVSENVWAVLGPLIEEMADAQ